MKPAPTPLTCPMSWSPFGTSCYYVSTLSKHWQGGQEFCQNHGAHLAIIHTAEEQVQNNNMSHVSFTGVIGARPTHCGRDAFADFLRVVSFISVSADVSVGSTSQRPLERVLVRDHRRADGGSVEVGGWHSAGWRVGPRHSHLTCMPDYKSGYEVKTKVSRVFCEFTLRKPD